MANKKKIILIEDDEGVTRLIQFKLAKEGYEIVVFPNGENVTDYLLTNKVSLVISDVMMPIVDGLTILKQIKSTPEIADIPVILLSTYSHESIILEGLRAGAADYITKPFSTSELLMRIQKALLK
ncbi:MAG: response regulator [Bacteroidetes bacterium]|nr:response regulator [Bacteroidota bacterium]